MKSDGTRVRILDLSRLTIMAICAATMVCGSALALRVEVAAGSSARNSNVPQASTPISVSTGVMAKYRIGGPNPKYPKAAKKAGIQGTVGLEALIGKDGKVEKLTIVYGPKELQQSTLDAVRKWKYKPFRMNGNPVEVKTMLTVMYSLNK